MAFFRWWRRHRGSNGRDPLASRPATEDHVARGSSPRDAATSARRELGNIGQIQEATRDVWGWRWLEHLGQDIRYASGSSRAIRGSRSWRSCRWRWASARTRRCFRSWTRCGSARCRSADPGRLVDIHIVDMTGARGSFETWQPAVTYPIWREIEAGSRRSRASSRGAWIASTWRPAVRFVRRPASGRAANSSTSSACSRSSDARWAPRTTARMPGTGAAELRVLAAHVRRRSRTRSDGR